MPSFFAACFAMQSLIIWWFVDVSLCTVSPANACAPAQTKPTHIIALTKLFIAFSCSWGICYTQPLKAVIDGNSRILATRTGFAISACRPASSAFSYIKRTFEHFARGTQTPYSQAQLLLADRRHGSTFVHFMRLGPSRLRAASVFSTSRPPIWGVS